MTKVHPKDLKYLEMLPEDVNFSPEHNQRVIDSTIKKYEAMRAKKQREFEDKAGERTQATAQYLKSLQQGEATSDALKYFGRTELARLRGQEVMEQLQEKLKVVRKDGKVLKDFN